jgi:hypothetical protein
VTRIHLEDGSDMREQMTLGRFLSRMIRGWGFSHDTWIKNFGEKLGALNWQDKEVEITVDFDSQVVRGEARRIYTWHIVGAELPRNNDYGLSQSKTFTFERNDEGFNLAYNPKS